MEIKTRMANARRERVSTQLSFLGAAGRVRVRMVRRRPEPSCQLLTATPRGSSRESGRIFVGGGWRISILAGPALVRGGGPYNSSQLLLLLSRVGTQWKYTRSEPHVRASGMVAIGRPTTQLRACKVIPRSCSLRLQHTASPCRNAAALDAMSMRSCAASRLGSVNATPYVTTCDHGSWIAWQRSALCRA